LYAELTKKIVERFDYLKVFLPLGGSARKTRRSEKNNKTPLSFCDISPKGAIILFHLEDFHSFVFLYL